MSISINAKYLEHCLAGKRLYGDEFGISQIEKWVADESEAYYDLAANYYKLLPDNRQEVQYRYEYHAINARHGYRFLKTKNLNVLGIGSAQGDELRPIISRYKNITILEPGKKVLEY